MQCRWLPVRQGEWLSIDRQPAVVIDSNVGSTLPPTAAGVNSAAFWVTARVSQTVPQLFSAVMGNTSGKVAARATAGLNPAKDCIYVLDPSASGAYYQNGSTTVTSACGIYVNSNSATAMTNSGNSTLQRFGVRHCRKLQLARHVDADAEHGGADHSGPAEESCAALSHAPRRADVIRTVVRPTPVRTPSIPTLPSIRESTAAASM